MRATATGEDGAPSTTTSTFKTLKPKVTATYGILNSGETVGVGMPASIQFDSRRHHREDARRGREAGQGHHVAQADGAWGWLDNRQLMWRPAELLAARHQGHDQRAADRRPDREGKWVGNDDTASFTVGSSMISTVDIKRHVMTVTRDGKVIKMIPISAGRPGPQTETRSGIKVIIRKEGT